MVKRGGGKQINFIFDNRNDIELRDLVQYYVPRKDERRRRKFYLGINKFAFDVTSIRGELRRYRWRKINNGSGNGMRGYSVPSRLKTGPDATKYISLDVPDR